MKTPRHTGNVTVVIRNNIRNCRELLLVLKSPKDKADDKRRRKRVGAGLWVPPGGGTESFDRSQKHAAQRELFEETGLRFPLQAFRKAGTLKGYNGSGEELLWLVHLYLLKTRCTDQKLILGPKLVDGRWFQVSKLPFKQMLTGDRDWIPRLVGGQKLAIKIVFNKDEKDVTSKEIKRIRSFN